MKEGRKKNTKQKGVPGIDGRRIKKAFVFLLQGLPPARSSSPSHWIHRLLHGALLMLTFIVGWQLHRQGADYFFSHWTRGLEMPYFFKLLQKFSCNTEKPPPPAPNQKKKKKTPKIDIRFSFTRPSQIDWIMGVRFESYGIARFSSESTDYKPNAIDDCTPQYISFFCRYDMNPTILITMDIL